MKGEIFNLSEFIEVASECSEDRISLIGVSDVGKKPSGVFDLGD